MLNKSIIIGSLLVLVTVFVLQVFFCYVLLKNEQIYKKKNNKQKLLNVFIVSQFLPMTLISD